MGERDIFSIHKNFDHEVVEEMLRMEADAANMAAQLLYDALVLIAETATEDNIVQVATEVLESINRED